MEIFGISKFISVPLAAVLVWLLIVKGSYRIVERVFLVACVIYLAYPLAALSADVPWGEVARASITPTFRADGGFVAMAFKTHPLAEAIFPGLYAEHPNTHLARLMLAGSLGWLLLKVRARQRKEVSHDRHEHGRRHVKNGPT